MTRVWVLASFDGDDALLEAARRLRALGLRSIDVHSPYPIHGADEALGLPRSRVPIACAIGGFGGALLGYLLQWWTNAVDYPINVGGRPLHAPPSFIPITFELGVLLGAFGAFFGLLAAAGLPRPHHPVFEAEPFRRASVDERWLSAAVEASIADETADELRALGARRVEVVREG